MKSFFRVAEHCFSVDFIGSSVNPLMLLPSMAPFACPPTDAPLLFSLAVHRTTPEGARHLTQAWEEIGTYDSGELSHRVCTNASDDYLIEMISFEKEHLGTLVCDARFGVCRLYLDSPSVHHTHCTENALMLAFAFAGAHHGILLMHASVPMVGKQGFLFLGKSGMGKSTHSRLWLAAYSEVHLLNDDNPAVRYDAEAQKAYVYGTPWSGKTPCYRNLRREIGGFLRLHQAPHNEIHRQKPVEAFSSILSSCSSMIWDKALYSAICDTIGHIVTCTPCYDLECLPDLEAARLSHDTMISR